MTSKTYRYKLDPIILENIQKFAEKHRYDDSHDFSYSYERWLKDNKGLVDREERRLTAEGCDKNIRTKIYKSARYYFKNKTNEEKEPMQRREYVGSSKEFREAIDAHISKIANNLNLKPANAFSNFIDHVEYQKIITDTVEDFRGYGFSTDIIDKKIKKTYKNRYFTHQKT